MGNINDGCRDDKNIQQNLKLDDFSKLMKHYGQPNLILNQHKLSKEDKQHLLRDFRTFSFEMMDHVVF